LLSIFSQFIILHVQVIPLPFTIFQIFIISLCLQIGYL
jgi:hypothetical protein